MEPCGPVGAAVAAGSEQLAVVNDRNGDTGGFGLIQHGKHSAIEPGTDVSLGDFGGVVDGAAGPVVRPDRCRR
ncbi:hypothetical protein GCM10009702_24080 [Propioniferax innocua]